MIEEQTPAGVAWATGGDPNGSIDIVVRLNGLENNALGIMRKLSSPSSLIFSSE
jgi:hypothetical protein